jgi:hypothetical protein
MGIMIKDPALSAGIHHAHTFILLPEFVPPFFFKRDPYKKIDPGAGQTRNLSRQRIVGLRTLAGFQHDRNIYPLTTDALYQIFLRRDTDKNIQGILRGPDIGYEQKEHYR